MWVLLVFFAVALHLWSDAFLRILVAVLDLSLPVMNRLLDLVVISIAPFLFD